MASLLDLLLYGPNAVGYGPDGSPAPQTSSPNFQPPALAPSPTPPPQQQMPQPQSGLSALTNPPAPLAPLVHPSGAGQPPVVVAAPPLDNWQPKQNGILGQISDYILGTHIGRGIEQKNMEGALEHLTTNPMEAVRRLSKFDAKDAINFFNTVQDNTRQQGTLDRQNRITDLVTDKMVDSVTRNMLASATDEPSFQAIRNEALNYAQKYGRDYSTQIPDTYDPVTLKSYVEGGVNVGKQQQIAQGDARVQQGDRRLDQGDRRLNQGDVRLQQTGEDTDSKVQTRAARVQQGQARLNMQQQGAAAKQTKIIPTKNGNMVVMGNKGVIQGPDGMLHRFITNDGSHWVHVDTVAPGGK